MPSSQGVPSGFAEKTQDPVAGSHVPDARHWLEGAHVVLAQRDTPPQFPAEQMSPKVRGFPSLQAVPSSWRISEHCEVDSLQAITLHCAARGHCVPPMQERVPAQTPPRQTSFSVKGFPSSHAVLSGFASSEQAPVLASQGPGRWHESDARHAAAAHFGVPRQSPSTHTSFHVVASASSHGVPSVSNTTVHPPVCGTHAPRLRHCRSGGHATPLQGSPPAQTPFRQASRDVAGLLSLQGVPSGRTTCRQAPPSHTGVWQGLAVPQVEVPQGRDAMQTPAEHLSFSVARFASEQAEPSGFAGSVHIPVAARQTPG